VIEDDEQRQHREHEARSAGYHAAGIARQPLGPVRVPSRDARDFAPVAGLGRLDRTLMLFVMRWRLAEDAAQHGHEDQRHDH